MTSVHLMKKVCARSAPHCIRTSLATLAVAFCWTFGPTVSVMGQEVIAIEEDWELVVRDPDTNSSGPQITCTISPVGGLDGVHAVLELNHGTLPDYAAGGLQIQLWDGEEPIDAKDFPEYQLLRHAGESIRWTQRMRLDSCQLTFEVVDGSSASWGTFGGQGYLKHVCHTSLANLNQYAPSVSVQHSGIGYAANRVDRLVLKEIRVYLSNGEVVTNSTLRVVHGE